MVGISLVLGIKYAFSITIFLEKSRNVEIILFIKDLFNYCTTVWGASLQQHRALAGVHRVGEADLFYWRVLGEMALTNSLGDFFIYSLSSHGVSQLLSPSRIFQAVQESKQLHSISQVNDYW